jgi:predicted nucleic acid-binding protein
MEVAVAGVGLPGATQVSRAGWIDVVPARNSRGLELVTAGTVLGAGEVSTVLLAKELSAEVVLIDESRARRFAKTEGLTVIGCIGILEVLHRRGDLPELRAAYLRLLEKDIRIDVLILQQSLAKFNLPPL